SRLQGARDAKAAAQMALRAPQAARGHEAFARGTVDEARRRTQASPDRLALDRIRGGREQRRVQLPARPQEAAKKTAARRTISAAHQSHRARSGQAVELLSPARGGGRSVQEPQKRPRHPADLSSREETRIEAHV